MARAKGRAAPWTTKRVRDVLGALKRSGFFKDLDAKHGYGARDELSFGRRMQIIKLAEEARQSFDFVEVTNAKGKKELALVPAKPVAIFKTAKKKELERARAVMGLKSARWKAVPVPVMAGTKNVRISLDPARNRMAVDYPDWKLQQYIVNFDHEVITASVNYDDEEETQVDRLVEGYQDFIREELGDLEDGQSYFRLNTVYGDIGADKYQSTVFLSDIVDRHIPRLVGRYHQATEFNDGSVEVDVPPLLTGVSVWRRTGKPEPKATPKNWRTTSFRRAKKVYKYYVENSKTGARLGPWKLYQTAKKNLAKQEGKNWKVIKV